MSTAVPYPRGGTESQPKVGSMVDTVDAGHEAMERHAWSDAVEAFIAADRDGGLSPEDLERLGTSAWWAGRPDDATEALERAFAGYTDAGQPADAARVALDLAY